MIDELWSMAQRSRSLQNFRADIHGIWSDSAAADINNLYLDPHQDADDEMRRALDEQKHSLDQAQEACDAAQEHGIEAVKLSQRVEKSLEEIEQDLKIVYQQIELFGRSANEARAKFATVKQLIAQANGACGGQVETGLENFDEDAVEENILKTEQGDDRENRENKGTWNSNKENSTTENSRPSNQLIVTHNLVSKYGVSINPDLVHQLKRMAVKHTPENIVRIVRDQSRKVVFLEGGDLEAGFQHIIERHRKDFADRGIMESEIPDVIMFTIANGKYIESRGKSGKVFEINFKGENQQILVVVSSNGFIVTAHPV